MWKVFSKFFDEKTIYSDKMLLKRLKSTSLEFFHVNISMRKNSRDLPFQLSISEGKITLSIQPQKRYEYPFKWIGK